MAIRHAQGVGLGSQRFSAAFVGRGREMEILQARLEDAVAGQSSLTMLAGEPGIGKTRIADEFAEIARRQGVLALWGRSFEGDWQPPYGLWVEALGEYAGSANPDLLLRQLGPGAAPMVHLVPAMRAALPDTPAPASLNPDEERFRLYDAVSQFLVALAAEEALSAGRLVSLRKLNHEFHMSLYAAAKTKRLYQMVVGLWSQYPWDTLWVIEGQAERSVAEHREILGAVAAGDADLAGELIKQHVEGAAESVIRFIEQNSVSGA